jgi:hypothetical protein
MNKDTDSYISSHQERKIQEKCGTSGRLMSSIQIQRYSTMVRVRVRLVTELARLYTVG